MKTRVHKHSEVMEELESETVTVNLLYNYKNG